MLKSRPIIKLIIFSILFYLINQIIGFYVLIPIFFKNINIGKWFESFAYFILYFIFLMIIFFRIRDNIKIKKSIKGYSFFLIGVTLTFIQILIWYFINGYLPRKNLNFESNDLPYILSRTILIPILEELIFRLVFFKILIEKYSFLITISISSILFSLVHLPNINQCIVTLVLGFISGLVYFKSNNILNSILLHIGLNSSVMLMRYIL